MISNQGLGCWATSHQPPATSHQPTANMDTRLKEALDTLAKHQPPHHKNRFLGTVLNVSSTSVYHWYQGRNLPRPAQLLVIEELSGVDLSHLLQVRHDLKPVGDPATRRRLKLDRLLNVLTETTEEKQTVAVELLELIIKSDDVAPIKMILEALKYYDDK